MCRGISRSTSTSPSSAAREMTVLVLDRQSGVPIRVYGVVPQVAAVNL
jgi:hypothetical protein